MPIKLKSILKYFLLTLAAVIVTFLTQTVDLYGHPYITQPGIDDICNTTAFYKLQLPPSHDSGIPIPYITHYVSDGGCGLGRPITIFLFILDVLIWLVVLNFLVNLVKNVMERLRASAHVI
jgi:hypothetical protein